jgi:RNA polymerase sigma factor (sigma-70 family)
MDGQELFRVNLPLVDRIIESVCRRIGVFGADAEDLASSVYLALIEDDYAILAAYEGRSALPTYLTIVIQRLISDERTRARGRWHASAEAERIGPAGVLIERLIRRDGRSPAEVVPIVRAIHPDLREHDVEAILTRLPERIARPRAVELPVEEQELAGADRADAAALDSDTRRLSTRTSDAVCAFMAALALSDRMLLRLRFGSGLSIADVSRMLNLPQRPLYRRVEALLGQLRQALTAAGIDARTAIDLIGDAAQELDFGFSDGKSEDGSQSIREAGENK